MLSTGRVVLGLVVLAVAILYRSKDGGHMPGWKVLIPHKWYVLRNIWTPDATERLLRLVENRGLKGYTTVADDYTADVEDIGEAQPLGPAGCAHIFLTPNKNHTKCVFPSRIDAGRHYVTHGGSWGRKERYEDLIPRVMPFSGFIFDQLDDPDLQLLFKSPEYVAKGREVCLGRPIFDPVQLGIIVTLPGQEVSMHADVPWFWGATRFTIPQWLLIVMAQSHLFDHLRVPQVQGVAYLHKWADFSVNRGSFFFWPNGTTLSESTVAAVPTAANLNVQGRDPHANDDILALRGHIESTDVISVPPEHNTALILDGSEVIHGAEPYRPHEKPPRYDKNAKNEMVHLGGGVWELRSDGKVLRNYRTEDFRISLVWRARCFQNLEEKAEWSRKSKSKDPADRLSVSSVIDVLWSDLQKRGRIAQDAVRPPPLEMGLLLLDEYVRYPRHFATPTTIPFNYCMLLKRFPGVFDVLLNRIC